MDYSTDDRVSDGVADSFERSQYHNGIQSGLDGVSLRIDRLAGEVLTLRKAVATLALAQGATMLVFFADILVRVS